jgi:hypothetical protein
MTYPSEDRFNNVKSTGMARAIEFVKLGLKELPRLHHEFLSNSHERHVKARQEALAIFARLDKEIDKIRFELEMPAAEFFIALRRPANYTPEEQEALTSLPGLLKLYGIDIFTLKPSAPKKRKRHPPFKV